jgi:hypothetical protein
LRRPALYMFDFLPGRIFFVLSFLNSLRKYHVSCENFKSVQNLNYREYLTLPLVLWLKALCARLLCLRMWAPCVKLGSLLYWSFEGAAATRLNSTVWCLKNCRIAWRMQTASSRLFWQFFDIMGLLVAHMAESVDFCYCPLRRTSWSLSVVESEARVFDVCHLFGVQQTRVTRLLPLFMRGT